MSAIPFAWMGWGFSMPSDWRPLSLRGGWRDGAAVLGNSEWAMLSVKWHRPRRRRFDPEQWISRRMERAACLMREPEGSTPAGFSIAARSAIPSRWHGVPRDVWCGYAPQAGLLLEIVINPDIPADLREIIDRLLLPSLFASHSEQTLRLALFGTCFNGPPGSSLQAWHLMLGDIALLLALDRGGRLLLRQVYPARLALSRRALPRWLSHSPFRDRRRFIPDGDSKPCKIFMNPGHRAGLYCRGSKRFPFPAGGVRAFRSMAAAVQDAAIDRIFIVQYDAREEPDSRIVLELFQGMGTVASCA
jgi:hypothetical protein